VEGKVKYLSQLNSSLALAANSHSLFKEIEYLCSISACLDNLRKQALAHREILLPLAETRGDRRGTTIGESS